MTYDVRVDWLAIEDNPDAWDWTRALYAILTPSADEIVYIGKADGCSVCQRWSRSGKRHFWDHLEKDRGYTSHCFLVGDILLKQGRRLSRQLLADIESLLIFELEPTGNIQSVQSRTARPGLVVRCSGAWPFVRRVFRD